MKCVVQDCPCTPTEGFTIGDVGHTGIWFSVCPQHLRGCMEFLLRKGLSPENKWLATGIREFCGPILAQLTMPAGDINHYRKIRDAQNPPA